MAAPQCIALSYFMALVLSGVRYEPPRHSRAYVPREVDFVVVGGGSGGSTVASRLSEVQHWQVLLLEAGPEEPVLQQVPSFSTRTYSSPEYDWQLKVEPSENDQTGTIARAKMLGGCSAHNQMVYLRGTPADYKCWVEAGADGWSFEDVLPFFKKSENNLDPDVARNKRFHSCGGPLGIQRMPYQDANVHLLRSAYRESGLPEVDLNGGHDEGFWWSQTTSHYGQRSSANTAFLSGPRRYRRNLHVATGSLVKKVHINATTKRAEAVEYEDKDGATRIVRVRKEVVLSAGTYFSPQLLMVSGVGPADQLTDAGIPVIADLPDVGTNLQDHTMGNSLPEVLLNATSTVPTVAEMTRDARWYGKGGGPLTTAGVATMVIRMRSELQSESEARPAIQVQHSGGLVNAEVPFCKHDESEADTTLGYYNQIVPYVVLLHSQDAGYLELNKTNPYGPPLIHQKIFSNDEDVRVYAAGVKQITEALAASDALRDAGATVSLPLQGAACGADAVGSQGWYECAVKKNGGASWGHGVGTCSIGRVVDPRLRVQGVLGLRVADASVMPCVPSGNTNAPSIMIGERAAHFIKQDHGIRWQY